MKVEKTKMTTRFHLFARILLYYARTDRNDNTKLSLLDLNDHAAARVSSL